MRARARVFERDLGVKFIGEGSGGLGSRKTEFLAVGVHGWRDFTILSAFPRSKKRASAWGYFGIEKIVISLGDGLEKTGRGRQRLFG